MHSKKTFNLLTKDKLTAIDGIKYGLHMVSKYAERWKELVMSLIILTVVAVFVVTIVTSYALNHTGMSFNLYTIYDYIDIAFITVLTYIFLFYIVCFSFQTYLITEVHFSEWNILVPRYSKIYYLTKTFAIIITFLIMAIINFLIYLSYSSILSMISQNSTFLLSVAYIIGTLFWIGVESLFIFVFCGLIYEYLIHRNSFFKSLYVVLVVTLKGFLQIPIYSFLVSIFLIPYVLVVMVVAILLRILPYTGTYVSYAVSYWAWSICFFIFNIKYMNIKQKVSEYILEEHNTNKDLHRHINKGVIFEESTKVNLIDNKGKEVSKGNKNIKYKSHSFKIDTEK